MQTDVATENKKIVLELYNELFIKRNIDSALKYFRDDFKQHNPFIPDGREAFMQSFREHITKFPNHQVEIKRVIAEGDLVMVHARATGGPFGPLAVVNIFRVQDGQIAEHWDIFQPVPEKPLNDNTMF